MDLCWGLCTVLFLHENVPKRLLSTFVHVSKPHDLLGVGGGEKEKLPVPKRKGLLVTREQQDAVSEGRGDVAAAVSKSTQALEEKHARLLLLPASVKLFDGTELIEELLVDQPWHQEEFVVCHELVDYLLLHPFGLWRADRNHVKELTPPPPGPAPSGPPE